VTELDSKGGPDGAVQLIPANGARKTEHPTDLTQVAGPDWDNVRVFLEVARSSSFRTAAQRLRMTGQAVSERVKHLERQLDILLFTRHHDGVRLTEDGQKLLCFAAAMEDASKGFLRRRGGLAQPLEGEVRVAVTEGLGTFWVTPRLMEFLRAHPKILIDLHCSMQRPDELVLRAEADLAVQIEEPVPRDLKIRRIGRMHVMPCASQDYIDRYGMPQTKDDIASQHRLVAQYADQGRGAHYYNQLFPGRVQTGFMAMRTDASTAMYAAVVNGLACGWLPTYYFALGTTVVPLDIGHDISFDIWLSYHADAAKLPRVRRMIDWTIDVFDPQQNPWFRDDFIHPREFTKYPCSRQSLIDVAFGHAKTGP
jgi:DNA-binding transcriptional LysR family regulator